MASACGQVDDETTITQLNFHLPTAKKQIRLTKVLSEKTGDVTPKMHHKAGASAGIG